MIFSKAQWPGKVYRKSAGPGKGELKKWLWKSALEKCTGKVLLWNRGPGKSARKKRNAKYLPGSARLQHMRPVQATMFVKRVLPFLRWGRGLSIACRDVIRTNSFQKSSRQPSTQTTNTENLASLQSPKQLDWVACCRISQNAYNLRVNSR